MGSCTGLSFLWSAAVIRVQGADGVVWLAYSSIDIIAAHVVTWAGEGRSRHFRYLVHESKVSYDCQNLLELGDGTSGKRHC